MNVVDSNVLEDLCVALNVSVETQKKIQEKLPRMDYDQCVEFETVLPLRNDISLHTLFNKMLFFVDGKKGECTLRFCRQS